MRITPITILAILLIACLVATPFILAEGRDLFKEFRDAWFKDWGAGFGESQAELGFWVEYADGTKDEITPTSSIPLTVVYKDKEIDYLGTAIWIKVFYEKELSSIGGTFELNLYIDGEPWDVSAPHYPTATTINQDPPESGVWTKLRGGGLSGSVREVEKRDNGKFTSHTIKGVASIEITLNFADGSTEHLDGQAEGTLSVNVVQIATLDVEVRPNVASVFPTTLS